MIRFDNWSKRGRWWPTRRFAGPAVSIIVHHSVTTPTSEPVADARTIEDVIYARRFRSRFSMVAYSYLIHPDGTVLEGRGVTWRNGANADRKNTGLGNARTLSVCMIGSYHPPAGGHDELTDAQVVAFRQLADWLESAGYLTNSRSVNPHSAVAYTDCCGDTLRSGLDRLINGLPVDTFDEDEEDDMITLFDTGTGDAWTAANGIARKLHDPDAWLAGWDGPVRRSPNMRFVIPDHYEVK